MTAPNPSALTVDATELSHEEWFFLWTAFGQKPDASLREANEYRSRALGMSRAEQMVKVQIGLESLLARGLVVQDTHANGKPMTTPDGKPIYRGVGRIITRMKDHAPVTFKQ